MHPGGADRMAKPLWQTRMAMILLVIFVQSAGAGVERLCMEHCTNMCAELNGNTLDHECGACDAGWKCNPAAADFPVATVAVTVMGEQLLVEKREQLPMEGTTPFSPSDSASPVPAAVAPGFVLSSGAIAGCDVGVCCA